MHRPRTPGVGITRAEAGVLLAGRNGTSIIQPGPAVQRPHTDLSVQRAVNHLHRLGPRPVGKFLAELLDAHRIEPDALDRLLEWQRLSVNALSEKTKSDLQKILALLPSNHNGERHAAIATATRILDRHGLKRGVILSLPLTVKREPLFATWWIACQKLMLRNGELRPWERKFVSDLPSFPRISNKQRYILAEIAERVLGQVSP